MQNNLQLPLQDKHSILEYKQYINQFHPQFIEYELELQEFACKITPWKEWSTNDSPSWWKAYSKIKHNRKEFFHLANLNNAILAVGALFICVIYAYKTENSKPLSVEYRHGTKLFSPYHEPDTLEAGSTIKSVYSPKI